jgi:peptidoglycan LD-endopeptidase CwlK
MDLKTLQEKSNVRLNHPGMNPVVRDMGKELVKRAHAAGVPVCITQGFRSIAEQNALYAKGRYGNKEKIVTNAPGGYSNHNFGLAIDFALYTPNGEKVVWDQKVDYDRDGKADWAEVVAIAKSLGFAWGGDWRGFPDAPHFEYTFGLTMAQLRAGVEPPTTAGSKPAASGSKPKTYKVVSGDTLSEISEQVKVSVANIVKWNGIKKDLIIPGQVLKLVAPGEKKPAKKPSAEKDLVAFPGKPLHAKAKAADMEKIDIERIQRAVKAPVTGKFDAATTKAVKAYQKRKKLEDDGIVGQKTWSLLF